MPDARTLFDRAQATAKSFHSLQFTAETTMSGLPAPDIKTEISSAYLNPGKTRTEAKAVDVTILDVSDGETTWVYNSLSQQYTKIPAAQGPAAVVASMGVKLPDLSSVQISYTTIGEETIEIGGQKHACWKVEMQIGEFTLPSPNDQTPPAKMTGGVVTSWIDKQLGIEVHPLWP